MPSRALRRAAAIVGREPPPILLELLPVDVRRHPIFEQADPLLGRDIATSRFRLVGDSPRRIERTAAVGLRARMHRVPEPLVASAASRPPPGQSALARTLVDPLAKLDPVGHEVGMRLRQRSEFPEFGEHQRHDRADLFVRVQRDASSGRTEIANGYASEQFTATGFVLLPLMPPRPRDVPFRLAHRPLQAQEQAIVEIGRVVDPVGIGQQDLEDAAEFQELVPVGPIGSSRDRTRCRHAPARPRRAIAGNRADSRPKNR